MEENILKKIGFIGTGLMGLPMCSRLLNAGFSLAVWNRSADKCAPLIAAGATHASSLQELAHTCSIIMICVADTAAVEQVAYGERGFIAHLNAAHTVIDFSSIDAAATQKLAACAQEKNAHWIDCPMSGGVVGAETGALVMMAGGDAAALASAQFYLAPLAQRVTHMGGSGAGQISKMCNQLIVAANAVLIAEAVALAEHAGVDASKLSHALAGGFADSKPFQLLVPRMSARSFEPVQWRVQTLLKDLDMAAALAAQHAIKTPSLAATAAQFLREHGNNGFLQKDLSSVVLFFSGDKKQC